MQNSNYSGSSSQDDHPQSAPENERSAELPQHLHETYPHLTEANARLLEAEQRLRLALESGRLGSWDLCLETHRYLEISDIWKQNFGRPDVGNITQEEFFLFLHADDRERVHEDALSAVKERRDYSAQYRTIWPDGSLHWISAHGKLLYDNSGNPKRLIGVTQIIDDRKQAEEDQERTLQDALDQADRDPLTGLLNHRAFHQRSEEEAARAQREGTTLTAVMLDLDNFKFFNNVYGHAVGDQVLRQVAAKLQSLCRTYDTLARCGGDEFALLLPGGGETGPAEIAARLRRSLRGLTFTPDDQETAIPLIVSLGAAQYPQETQDRTELLEMADARLLRAKRSESQETQAEQMRFSLTQDYAGFSMLDALVTSVDNKDRYTCRHSEDVMKFGLLIARQMGMEEGELRVLAMAALLHDVGNIGVPDAILRKPGKLTDDEFTAVKQHPEMGASMLSSVAGLEEALPAVRHHHERWDGTGYPLGLRGEEIPPLARLLAVADAFSAMTTDRPYRQGMSRSQALAILEAGSGIHWDPEYVKAFAAAVE